LTSTTGIIENQNSVSSTCTVLTTNGFGFDDLTIINPVSNHKLQFSKTISADSVTIYDTYGRSIFSQNSFVGDTIEINLSPSVYIICIKSDTSIKTQKVLISQ
jgi:hypothetical protein